ncbi:hypothetical protein [Cohnella sp. REN36]|uniref:hypothetical protein n=1 Tax=Cohnella sp. REN36 TaxID=2887347 RepID=UPI001D133DC4|nr:hypothetical protein [Cohnella sp. REN36]MCC3375297.1 hypothetical protein [Cohnella sp. REN36]
MFDPTIFDNLKVALENRIYDLDNLDGVIRVSDRVDRLELAAMARAFSIRFHLAAYPAIEARIGLEASLQDLAAEILETPGASPGCALRVGFRLETDDPERTCPQLERLMREVWGEGLSPKLTVRYEFGEARPRYRVSAELPFGRKINEEQMEDLDDLVDHALRSLELLCSELKEG